MGAIYNSLDFALSVEVETCVRDPSSFAGQVPRFSNRIKVHLFNTVYPVINSAGRRPDEFLVSCVKTVPSLQQLNTLSHTLAGIHTEVHFCSVQSFPFDCSQSCFITV